MAAIDSVRLAVMPDYYEALRTFSAIIDAPNAALSFKLRPGAGFLIDNTRSLHARSAFSHNGGRRLQGSYADKDGLLSTLRSRESGDALSTKRT